MIDWTGLEARNATLNAFVDWDKDAAASDGPLRDLTIGIKANIAVRGLPWTAGMALHRDRIAVRDAAVVSRLRGAGATILGTLNMHEAALGATTDNAFYGRTENGVRAGYTPGGSSGGSGAAVAAGLCDAALGTDTMGSVRIPAAYNGVYGLKPTRGAVDSDGLAMLEPSLDSIGPLARDLATLQRLWSVMRDAEAFSSPPSHALRLENFAGIAVEPDVAAACYAVVDRLSLPTSGMILPHAPRAVRTAGFIASARWLIDDLGAARTAQADRFSPELHFMLDYAETATSRPDIIAQTRMALIEALGSDGVLIMPTAPQVAFAHTARPPSNQADFTCLASVAGLPALSIPVGADGNGLPIGVQIVGPAGSEAQLIALAATLG